MLKKEVLNGMHYLDLRNPMQEICQGPKHWSGENEKGERIEFTNFYMKKNDKPIFLLAGEMHPTRTDERYWDESIMRMKAGGLNTVSFYIIWNHIEEKPGEFNFSGNKNIRRFVEICQKHDMYAWPRIGPFVNSEALHGGLPSWLYGMPLKERSNDPKYLFYVDRYYKEIGKQFEGLLFKDGGPIIAIQIENEYGHAPASWDTFYMYGAGPINVGDDGESHMLKLKEMAIKSGLIVPVYSCTGWGSPIPEDEYLPMYGCYAYLGDSGPTDTSTFSFGPKEFDYPAAFAELGGGAPTQREWRPIIPPESAEAGIYTRVACGGNITGLFIYHGGTNPTSYDRFYVMYDGMTLVSYDWNSPISEYGLIRDSYYQVKPIQQFLSDFQELFCPMVPVWQEKYVEPENVEDLRYMARVNGDGGFVFINNFQDKLQLPERHDVRLELALKDENLVMFEKKGISLSSGIMAIFPFNLNIEGVLLKYSSTQLLCTINDDGKKYWFFFAYDGTEAEYVFEQDSGLDISGGYVDKYKGQLSVKPKKLGFDSTVDVETSQGIVTIVTLNHSQAKRTTKTTIDGKEILLHSDCDLINDNKTVRVSCLNKRELSFSVFPHRTGNVRGPLGIVEGEKDGLFYTFKTSVIQASPSVEIKENGSEMAINLPKYQLQGLNDIYIKILYNGDIARAFVKGKMVTDHINDGTPWFIGLKRIIKEEAERDIYIKLEPKRDGVSKIVFDGITFHMTGQRIGEEPSFTSCEIIPEYSTFFTI